MPILVLDWQHGGRHLVYFWDTHTFALVAASSFRPNEKPSFAWDKYDDRFSTSEVAIAVRPTTLTTADGKQIDVPSGRTVTVGLFVEYDGKEHRDATFGQFAGVIAAQDLRVVKRIRLDSNTPFYVGSAVEFNGELKSCGITTSVENIQERSRELGVSLGLTFKSIFELKGDYKGADKNSYSSRTELSKDIMIRVTKLVWFAGPATTFWRYLPPPTEIEYTAIKIKICNSKNVRWLISWGNRQAELGAPVVIQNEAEFEAAIDRLREGGFSDEEAFSFLAVISRIVAKPPAATP